MQARSIFVAKRFGVPIHVRSSFSLREGTMIQQSVKAMEDIVVSGVTLQRDEAKVTIRDVPDKPGMAAEIFRELAAKEINVDMIVQNVSREGSTDVSFTVVKHDLPATLRVARSVSHRIGAGEVTTDEGVAKLSIVGIGMRSHSGVAAKMFEAMARERINIEMISTSEIKISCVIRKAHAERAVRGSTGHSASAAHPPPPVVLRLSAKEHWRIAQDDPEQGPTAKGRGPRRGVEGAPRSHGRRGLQIERATPPRTPHANTSGGTLRHHAP